jgi:hypothetical protein
MTEPEIQLMREEIRYLHDVITDEQAKVTARDLVIGDLCWVVAMMKDGLPYSDELVTARMQSLFAYHQDTE